MQHELKLLFNISHSLLAHVLVRQNVIEIIQEVVVGQSLVKFILFWTH